MGFFNSIFGKIILGVAQIAAGIFVPGLQFLLFSGIATIIGGVGQAAGLFKPPTVDDFDQSARARLSSFVDPNPVRRIIWGRIRAGGPIPYIAKSGTDGEFLHALFVLSQGELEDTAEKCFIGDTEVTFDGSGNGTGDWAGFFRIKKHSGAVGQTHDTDLATEVAEWTSAHDGDNVAYNYVRLKFSPDLYPDGVNTLLKMTFVVKGRKVLDPRDSTTAYQTVPALWIRDYMTDATDGMGIAAARIHDGSGETFRTAADDCEDAIDLDGGGTEPRYAGGGMVELSESHGDIIAAMLSAMGGQMVYVGGQYRLYAAKWRASVASFDEDDLRGPVSISGNIPLASLFNSVRGTFAWDNGDLFQPVDFPPLEDATFKTEDGGNDNWADITLPFTTSHTTAQRLSKIHLQRLRQQVTVVARFGLKALEVAPPDVISFSYARLGWVAKTFEVQAANLIVEVGDDGAPETTVELTLRETAASVYDWDETTEEQTPTTPVTPTVPDATTIADPTGMAVASGETIDGIDGLQARYLKVTWTAPADQAVKESGWIEAEYKANADSTWLAAGRVPGDAVRLDIRSVDEGTAYDVQIRSVNSSEVTGNWVQVLNTTLSGSDTVYSGLHDAVAYHSAAYRVKTTTLRTGSTATTSTWVTVASWTLTKPEGVTKYGGGADSDITVTVVPDDQTTWTGKGRLRIGSIDSNEISISNPTTSGSGAATVTGLSSPEASITVNLQVWLEFSGGTPGGESVQGDFNQVKYDDQDSDNFS